jgi:hypothetical protein
LKIVRPASEGGSANRGLISNRHPFAAALRLGRGECHSPATGARQSPAPTRHRRGSRDVASVERRVSRTTSEALSDAHLAITSNISALARRQTAVHKQVHRLPAGLPANAVRSAPLSDDRLPRSDRQQGNYDHLSESRRRGRRQTGLDRLCTNDLLVARRARWPRRSPDCLIARRQDRMVKEPALNQPRRSSD